MSNLVGNPNCWFTNLAFHLYLQHHYDSALFWSDKLVSLSDGKFLFYEKYPNYNDQVQDCPTKFVIFVFRLNIPVSNFSVVSGQSQRFLGLTSTVGS